MWARRRRSGRGSRPGLARSRTVGVVFQSGQVAAVEGDFEPQNRLVAQQLHDGLAVGRLAANRIADKCQRLVAAHVERHVFQWRDKNRSDGQSLPPVTG